MTRRCIRHVLQLLGASVVACVSSGPPSGVGLVAHIDLQGPTVVAFLPASMQKPIDADPAALKQQVAEALERARVCLGSEFASYRLVYADRIVVHTRVRDEFFDVATAIPLVGALLLRPDANPRIVFAGGGPDALRRMMRRAVVDYFERKCDG